MLDPLRFVFPCPHFQHSPTGSVTDSGAVAVFTVNNASANTFSGTLGGVLVLTKSGAGTLTLSGANSYTGLTTISVGALRAANNTALGTIAGGVSVASSAALELDGSLGALTIGAEALTLNGAGISSGGALRNIAGNNSYAGAIALGATGVRINSDGGTLTLSGGITGATFGLTVGGAGNTTITGIIGTTSGALTKDGGGTLTLSGSNSNTGVTTVTGGTLSTNLLANGGTTSGIGASGSANTNLVVNGGTLQYTGNVVSTNRLFSIGTAGGALDASGIGALNLTGTGAMGFNSQTGTRTLTLTGTNTDANTLASVIGDNTGATAVVKNGIGTWVLSGSNSYTGVTTIAGGILSTKLLANGGTASGIGASGSANTNLVFNGGTLQYTGTAVSSNRLFSIGAAGGTLDASGAGALSLTGTGAMGFNGQTGARTLTLTGTNTGANTLASAIGDNSGATTLVKSGSGTWVLTGSDTYTGETTIMGGMLKLSTATMSNIAGSSDIIVGDTQTNSSAVLDVSGVTNAGGYHVVSGQTLSGFGTVYAGTGKTVTVDSGAHWAPGASIGSDMVTGNLTLAGIADFQLGTPGSSHSLPGTGDFTAVSGTLTLGGNLNLTDNANSNGQGSAGAGSYKIFTQSGMAAGAYASVTDPASNLHARVDTSTSGSVFVDIYRLAASNSITPTVDLGNVHMSGTFGTTSLSIQNTAAGDGYSEGLNASGGSVTGAASTSGSFSNLAAGSTSTSVSVGLGGNFNTSTAGLKTGTVLISLASNGTNSGHGNTSLTGQTITVTGFVYSGQGIWNTNGSGNWSDTTKWQANGGSPGLDAAFVNADSATFGSALGSGTATVDLNGTSPSLTSLGFNTSGASYVIAQGSGNSPVKLNNGSGQATITDSNGSHNISAPVEMDSSLSVTVVNSADTLTISGPVSESGGSKNLTKAGNGTLALSGVCNYTGTTSVNSGVLEVIGSLNGTKEVDVSSGAALYLTGSINADSIIAVSGTLTGQCALGVIYLALGGKLSTTRPGSPSTGTLSATGFMQQPGAQLSLRIGGTTAATEYDQLIVHGGISLAGDLTGSLINNYTPILASYSAGHLSLDGSIFYLVIGATSPIIGTFANQQAGDANSGNYPTITLGGQLFAVSYTANFSANQFSGVGNDIALMAIPEPDVLGSIIVGSAFLIGLRNRRLWRR